MQYLLIYKYLYMYTDKIAPDMMKVYRIRGNRFTSFCQLERRVGKQILEYADWKFISQVAADKLKQLSDKPLSERLEAIYNL